MFTAPTPARPRAGSAALRTALGVLAAALACVWPADAWSQRAPTRSDMRVFEPIRPGMPDRQSGFTFCRLHYDSPRRLPSGLGWSTDYPGADYNLMLRVSQLTTADISRWRDGELGYAAVRATDPDLFRCPFLFASDIGSAGFSTAEALRLREFLAKGGFLWVDDIWGERAWAFWIETVQQILPGAQIVELTPAHPLFDTFYHVPEIPQIPSIQHWRRSGGQTSEFGAETEVPRMYAIFDEKGDMQVLISHNTDIADGWEREGDDDDFFYRFSARGYGVGINVVIWAMTR
jgi:hypothetical protein